MYIFINSLNPNFASSGPIDHILEGKNQKFFIKYKIKRTTKTTNIYDYDGTNKCEYL